MTDHLRIFHCPIDDCGWAHMVPWIDPAVDTHLLAEIFGLGVMAQVVTTQRAAKIERSVRDHLATHGSLDWLKTLHAMSRQRDALIEAINGFLDSGTGMDRAIKMQVAGDLLRELGERE